MNVLIGLLNIALGTYALVSGLQGQVLLFTQSQRLLIAAGIAISLLGHSQVVRASRESGTNPTWLERIAGVFLLAEGACYFANLPQPPKGPDVAVAMLGQAAVLAGLLAITGRHWSSKLYVLVHPLVRGGLLLLSVPTLLGLAQISLDDFGLPQKPSIFSVFFRFGPPRLTNPVVFLGALLVLTTLSLVLFVFGKRRPIYQYVFAVISLAGWATLVGLLVRASLVMEAMKATLR